MTRSYDPTNTPEDIRNIARNLRWIKVRNFTFSKLGLFSNNDNLSRQIHEAGEKVEEKAWRLPLHSNYDKLMNS